MFSTLSCFCRFYPKSISIEILDALPAHYLWWFSIFWRPHSTRVTPVTLINWSTNSKHLANIVLADCSSLLSSFVSLTFWLCIDINVRLQANQCGQFDFNILNMTPFPPSQFLCLTKQYFYLVHLKSSVRQSHAMNKCEPVVARHKVVVDGLILPATTETVLYQKI